MHRPTVLLARVLAYIDVHELTPGSVFFPDVVASLVQRYRFQKYPDKSEDLELSKGLNFADGVAGKVGIEKLTIWDNTLVLETRSSTDASKEVLHSMLMWATEQFGLNYRHGDIKRYAYISDVSFYSEEKILIFDPILDWLARETSSALTEIWQEPVEYLPTSIKVGHDPVLRQLGIAPFSIERRGKARFSENKYFSEAPLPTHVHLKLLEEFESRVRSKPRGI